MVDANGFHALLLRIEPILIILFFCASAAIIFYAGGEKAYAMTDPYTKVAKQKLDRAGIAIKAETLGIAIMFGSVGIWAVLMLLIRPSLLISFMILPLMLIAMIKGVEQWVNFKIARRQSVFINQLELVLRLMSSGVRAGLGIRQALVLVTEEMPDPAKYEFHLVLMQTNIGISLNDALTRLAERMPSQEVEMMTRSIIMQSNTGGNLGKTLDTLADTIKERRRIFRKVKALTAESRGSAWILGSLPIVVFGLILLTVPTFREPTFFTRPGQIGMLIAFVLEALGAYTLYRLTIFKV